MCLFIQHTSAVSTVCQVLGVEQGSCRDKMPALLELIFWWEEIDNKRNAQKERRPGSREGTVRGRRGPRDAVTPASPSRPYFNKVLKEMRVSLTDPGGRSIPDLGPEGAEASGRARPAWARTVSRGTVPGDEVRGSEARARGPPRTLVFTLGEVKPHQKGESRLPVN